MEKFFVGLVTILFLILPMVCIAGLFVIPAVVVTYIFIICKIALKFADFFTKKFLELWEKITTEE